MPSLRPTLGLQAYLLARGDRTLLAERPALDGEAGRELGLELEFRRGPPVELSNELAERDEVSPMPFPRLLDHGEEDRESVGDPIGAGVAWGVGLSRPVASASWDSVCSSRHVLECCKITQSCIVPERCLVDPNQEQGNMSVCRCCWMNWTAPWRCRRSCIAGDSTYHAADM